MLTADITVFNPSKKSDGRDQPVGFWLIKLALGGAGRAGIVEWKRVTCTYILAFVATTWHIYEAPELLTERGTCENSHRLGYLRTLEISGEAC